MAHIEVCLDSNDLIALEQNVSTAYVADANRIELCLDLSSGGVTPSPDAIAVARAAFKHRAGLLVMIRPRAGDFIYSPSELSVMEHQIKIAAELGADGVVFGTLTAENTIDEVALHTLMPLCRELKLKVTFHRAFDQVNNQSATLAKLVQFGVHRVLTNGTPWGAEQGAMQGIARINQVLHWAEDALEVVVGGGVDPDNIQQLHRQLCPDVTQISYHSHSGVMQDGLVSLKKLKAMIRQVSS